MLVFRRMLFKDTMKVQRLNMANSTETFQLSTFLNTLSMSSNTSFVAEIRNDVVGYVEAVAIPERSKGHIYSICVDGRFRRCGIARTLLGLATDAVAAHLAKGSEIDLHVRTTDGGAISLYLSMGFEVAEEDLAYYDGEHAYRMSMEIR